MNMVVLEVRSLAEMLADAARAMKSRRADREARISFATLELLWQLLTAKRWELLKAMCGAGPISIREAARRVSRDVKAVHGDAMALLTGGSIAQQSREEQLRSAHRSVVMHLPRAMLRGPPAVTRV